MSDDDELSDNYNTEDDEGSVGSDPVTKSKPNTKIKINNPINTKILGIGEAVKDINSLRVGTKFKPLTDRLLAIRINKNPFLKSDGELEFIIKQCRDKRNYAKLFWILR